MEILATTVSVREAMASVGTSLPSMDTRADANVWNISFKSFLEIVRCSVGCGV